MSTESGAGEAPGFWASIPPRVRRLIFTQAVNNFAIGYFLIYVTVYLVQINELNGTDVGLLLCVESVTLISVGIPVGIKSDRAGRKWFLVLGGSLLPPSLILFSLTHDLYVYLLVAVVIGVAEAMSLGSWNAIIADQTDGSNRDAAFSISFIVSGAFMAAGSALPLALPQLGNIVGVTTDQAHWGSLLVLGLFGIPMPALVWLLLRNYHETPTGSLQPDEPGELRRLLKFSAMNGVVGLGAGLIVPLLGTWLLYRFALVDIYSGPFIALTGITVALAAVASPRMSRRFGRFNALLMTSGTSTLFMFSMAFIPFVYPACFVYICRATLMNMASPLIDSYLMSIVRPGRRGLGSAIAAIVQRLPNSASTILGGYILSVGHSTGNQFLLEVPWLAASALYVLGIGLMYIGFRNVKTKS